MLRDSASTSIVGYVERSPNAEGREVYNSSVCYSAQEHRVIAKYHEVHLPGVTEPFPAPSATQQLKKRYFSHGNLGFPAFRAPGLVYNTLKAGDQVFPEEQSAGKGDPILRMVICNDPPLAGSMTKLRSARRRVNAIWLQHHGVCTTAIGIQPIPESRGCQSGRAVSPRTFMPGERLLQLMLQCQRGQARAGGWARPHFRHHGRGPQWQDLRRSKDQR